MATPDRKRPTDAELQILRVLWADGPSTVRQVLHRLNEARATGYTTVLKLMPLSRLEADSPDIATVIEEIESGLSDATLARLSDYTRVGNTDTLPVDNRVALALAGWYLRRRPPAPKEDRPMRIAITYCGR